MVKYGKRMLSVFKEFDRNESYALKDAVAIMQKGASKKFDESVDLSFNLGVNPRKSDQMVRGACIYPHGIGKDVKVLAIVPAGLVEEAKAAGADYAGEDEFIEKIQKEGWTDFDKLVTTPAMMRKVGRLGKVLGPRGLMPNPKLGTVAEDIAGAVKLVKAGRVEFKVNREGVLATTIGKASFGPDKLYDNALELVRNILKLKPVTSKGTYIKKIVLSSTMGPGIKLDHLKLIEEGEK